MLTSISFTFSGVYGQSSSRAVKTAIRTCMYGMAKYSGLAGGQTGRRHPAQLFLSLHVFANRLGTAAIGNVHLGNLLRAPNVGHLRASFLECPVFLPPTFMKGLRLQLSRLTSRIAGGVPAIPRGRSIHQLPDSCTVHGIASCLEAHQLG